MVATFNEAVVLGASGVITLKKTSDNSTIQSWNVATQAGTGAGQVSVVGATDLTMRLTSNLSGLTEYYVIWDAGVVQDGAGNPVAAQASTTVWSFTTVAVANPEIDAMYAPGVYANLSASIQWMSSPGVYLNR
jgi:hypothetical protein